MGREVSTLSLSLLSGYLDRRAPGAFAELAAGLPCSEADLRSPLGWVDWSVYAVLHHRIRERFPDDPRLFLEAGRSAVDLEAFGFVRIMASLVVDPLAVYKVVQRTVPVFLFRCITIDLEEAAEGPVLTYRLRQDLEPLPGFFQVVEGILAELPRLVGDDLAAVRAEALDPWVTRYRVTLPRRAGFLQRARTTAGNYLRWYPRAMRELEETNRRLQEQYEQIEKAYREIQEYRTRLEAMVDERTGQLSRANRSLEQSVSRLEALDRAKNELFANVSHELRTPLTMILGPVSSLLDGSAGSLDPEQRRLLGAVMDHSRRLLRQVNNLLDVAKLEAGQMRLRFRDLDLRALVEGLAAASRGAAQARGVALDIAPGPPLEPLVADAEQLEKVVLNLVGNAIKFTPAGGRIRLAVDETAGFERLIVEDTGEGIPADQLERIFERFTQVDGSATRRHGGTGIGLALVREIVALHAGHIDVDSRVGEGTRFVVWLPKGRAHVTDEVADRRVRDEQVGVRRRASDREIVRVEEVLSDLRAVHVADVAPGTPEEPPDDPAEAPPGDSRPLALVVEDDPDVRRYLVASLRATFRVRSAPDGLRGLAAALEHPPDVVVCDVMMPGIDGIELVRRLRAEPSGRGVPVVLVTARADPESRMRGLEAGADDYLIKPFSTRELLTRLGNAARLRASERELARRNEALERALRDLQRAQVELVSQAKMASLGQLVSGVAHELNNPVNFLCGAAFSIEEKLGAAGGTAPPPEVLAQLRRLAAVARVGGERVADIVESLRRFSGRSGRERSPTDLAEGIRLTLALLEPRIRAARTRVDLDVEGPITVVGHSGELNQVLMNLLTNAVQAAPGGTVRIRGGRQGEEVWAVVQDDGPGVPAEVRGRIFEPFFTTREPGEGTGLGLAISDTIVRAHGGRIEVDDAPGGGALFRLVLPAGRPGDPP